jgi:hypothetical protein
LRANEANSIAEKPIVVKFIEFERGSGRECPRPHAPCSPLVDGSIQAYVADLD